MNTLYYGDNLKILRDYIQDESVDLIYLDPPFNSNRNYNVLFKNETGSEAESQITAFEDTWHWNESAEATYNELVLASDSVGRMIESFRGFIGENQMMAYLVMMAVRLKELHRVLKPTGSLYLHCDPTASHYLKILLDTVFGTASFRNEIVWKRSSAHNDAKQGLKQMGRIHDTIYFYSKSADPATWRWNIVYTEYGSDYVKSNYRLVEEGTGRVYKSTDLTAAKPGGDTSYEWKGRTPTDGRYWAYSKENMAKFEAEGRLYYSSTGLPRLKQYLDEMPGISLQDIWTDIPPISSHAAEKLGYPTQKPVALLERIISASSNEGDVVLDPFCGCGTTIAAAQNLNREWIGIDVTHLAVGLQKLRLKDTFGLLPLGEKRSTKNSPPYEGGVAPASGDGVVLSSDGSQAENHPTANAAPLLRKEGSLGTYRVIGQPEDLAGAKELAENDRYGFQWWILPLVGAKALGAEAGKKEGKKGSDKGIDGLMAFIDDTSGKTKKVIFSVKSGHVNVSHIRDLVGTVEREKAAIGVYVTLEPPTGPMRTEAISAGFYHSEFFNKDFPKIQILTVEDILAGKEVSLPSMSVTFKKAPKGSTPHKGQRSMFEEPEDQGE